MEISVYFLKTLWAIRTHPPPRWHPALMQDESDITRLLQAASAGDESALNAVFPVVYDRLQAEAHRQLRMERDGHTLQTTALVHEAYLKLVDQREVRWQDRTHFFRLAAMSMRRILVDYARTRNRAKRGSGVMPVRLQDAAVASKEQPEILVALDDALSLMEADHPRRAMVVSCRYFAGYSIPETASLLDVSERTVQREWTLAKAQLFGTISRMMEK